MEAGLLKHVGIRERRNNDVQRLPEPPGCELNMVGRENGDLKPTKEYARR